MRYPWHHKDIEPHFFRALRKLGPLGWRDTIRFAQQPGLLPIEQFSISDFREPELAEV